MQFDLKSKIWRCLNRKKHQESSSNLVIEEVINFPTFKLAVNASDYGGKMYNERGAFEECQSLLYPIIKNSINPDVVVDVGANYGFTSLIFSQAFPNAQIIAVEPAINLQPFLNKNLADRKVKIIQAVCGSQNDESVEFGINPISSQDNRVIPQQGWNTISVPQISLDKLLETIPSSKSLFLKIDTQGFEYSVIQGASHTLQRLDKWIMKMEFAPFWLKSQGTDPNSLLNYLVHKYNIIESPARIPFGMDKFQDLSNIILRKEKIDLFISHVENLNRDLRGWVDLIVIKK
jgi:FkbM family methyltransferase